MSRSRRPTREKPTPNAVHYRWAALGVVVFAVYGSLLPFNYSYRPLGEALDAIQRIVMYDASDPEARGDWVISTALFTVLSYLLMAAVGVDRPIRYSLWAAVAVVPGCFALSASIEFLQLYFPPRTVSLNDILVESAGGIVGAIVWLTAGQRIAGWLRRLREVSSVAGLATRLLPGYVAVLLIVQLMPFDIVVSYDELGFKYSEGRVRLNPWGGPGLGSWQWPGKVGLNLACFFPLGFLLALSRRPGTPAGQRWASLGPMLAAPALVECMQLFVYSRTCDATDILTGMAGVYAGWRLGLAFVAAQRSAPSTSARPAPSRAALLLPLFLGWLGLVVYVYWRPFDFSSDPAQFAADREELPAYGFRRFPLAPFVDYYWGNKYNALDQFGRKALSFLPLGVLAAASSKDLYWRGAATRVLLVAFAIAVVLEAGRYFLPSHSPSTTDVLIAGTGAWIGFRLTHRVREAIWADRALLRVDAMSRTRLTRMRVKHR